VVFIESRFFTRRLGQLAGDAAGEVLRELQNDLLRDPARGDVVRGLGGIRKARLANPTRGKGTRGGFRYMHLYLEHREHIHLLCLFDKDEQEDLSEKERKALRQMVAELRRM
jgi:hypothetical protein